MTSSLQKKPSANNSYTTTNKPHPPLDKERCHTHIFFYTAALKIDFHIQIETINKNLKKKQLYILSKKQNHGRARPELSYKTL
jgi:hypothetical protein